MASKEDKLDKIIKLLKEIKANQPMPYYFFPPIYYPPEPQPYIPNPNPPDQPYWTTTDEGIKYEQ